MSPHPVPVVVARLYELVGAAAAAQAVPGDAVSVIRVDLGDPGEFEDFAAIGIGLGASPVQIDDQRPRRTPGYDHHEFDVGCLALAWSGDDDRLTWMVRAYELVDLVRDVLALPANVGLGLGKVVESARVDRTSFSWTEDARGLKAQVEFSVRVKAYRVRR